MWLQRRQQPERAREADILAHGTFYWDGERQGSVLVAVPTWLGDVDAARDRLVAAAGGAWLALSSH